MQEICHHEQCTGCQACYSICPTGAVNIRPDSRGFYKPQINKNRCIDCLSCQQVCPANAPLLKTPDSQQVYACHSHDAAVRSASSSGGFFTHLAIETIRQGGVVFGAVFGRDWRTEHAYAEDNGDIARFQGSKYVQSYIGDSFRQCRSFLQEGRKVLFSGTPCQIAGLNSYLQYDDTSLLTTVDLVCHGAPPHKIFSDYLALRAQIAGGAVTHVNFREKPNGWHTFGLRLKFAGGGDYFASFRHDPFIIGFLKNYYLNSACYSCKYANATRQGDITIADFWGYKDNAQLTDDDKGLTLVITNNRKGWEFYQKAQKGLKYTEKSLAEAVAGNPALYKPAFKHRDYDSFWYDYGQLPFMAVMEKYLQPKVK